MEFLYDLLFDITYNGDYIQLAIDTIIFVALWLLLLYVIYFLITKLIKGGIHKDFQLSLNFLWALGAFQFLIAIYMFFLIRLEGLKLFKWGDPNFYIGILPQLIVFIGTVVLFVNKHNQYLRSIKNS